MLVRQKAKDITNLLMDDTRLKEERRQRQGMRDRMANVGDYLNESVRGLNGSPGQSGQSWNDETELQKALVESKRMAAEDAKSRRRG
jgi:epsin